MPLSLDGLVARPHGEADWVFRTSGGADSTAWLLDTLNGAGVHIMGRQSHADTAAFWPFSSMPIAAPMNDIATKIFSRTGIQDGPRGEQLSQAFDEAKARDAERLGATPSDAVLQSWATPPWPPATGWRKCCG